MAEEEREYPLADFIKVVGADLREAQRRAQGDDEADLLRLKECTIELGLTWTKTGSGGGDIKVFKLGGDISKGNTETASVTLEPIADTVVGLAPG